MTDLDIGSDIGTYLGKDCETNEEIYLNHKYRRSGLYLLGKPGMGKSSLIVKCMFFDTLCQNGLFFIDPHGDAIKDFLNVENYIGFLTNICYYLLDPEEEHYSFGINPLYCHDLTSLKARTDTYTRAYNIFHKIWEDDWGVWLQLIIQNTLYAFIENPDYTLAEVPLFLINENFRYQLAKNIKYNLDVKDFWLARFEGKKPLDQQRQVDAALTRISTLLGHPYVKHIIGQQKSTIDFNRILSQGEIVLVKLSSALAEDIKKFVGTILISELLHAVRNRPEDNRRHFSIYVDEFQNFATSDDFATLITEARKYGIATTIAHQERFGQLGDNKKLLGATLAAANKVYFQLSVKDAQELAPELAEMSEDTAYRQGPDLVISTYPVEDIWIKGHPNSDIMEFHRKYFWIVELLKRKPDKGEYVFGPTTTPPEYLSYIEKYWLKKKIPWDEFTDWETYRATPQMLEQGIALINDYCYQCAQGKFNPTEPITREELDIVYKVVELLGGVLGVRPTMTAGITPDMKNLLLRKLTEWKDRTINEMKRANRFHDSDAWEKQVFQWEIKNTNPDLLVNWTLDHIPDEFLFIFNRLEWKQRAITAGFTLNEIDNFFSWKKRKYFEDEESIFKELIRSFFKNRGQGLVVEENHDLFLRYVRVMCSPVFYEKFRDKALNLPDDVKAAYHELLWDRNQWQTGIMCEFLYYSFVVLPAVLIAQPLKVPSGHYVEPLKREQTQRELIDKMAQDLSSLPRFHAWVKILQEKNGQEFIKKCKMKTVVLAELYVSDQKPIPEPLTSNLHKKRDEIEEEIAKRQTMWKRGLSSPPVEKKEERQADTSSKPPPTTTAG